MLHCKLENALLERSHFDALECSGNPNARENFPPAMLQNAVGTATGEAFGKCFFGGC